MKTLKTILMILLVSITFASCTDLGVDEVYNTDPTETTIPTPPDTGDKDGDGGTNEKED